MRWRFGWADACLLTGLAALVAAAGLVSRPFGLVVGGVTLAAIGFALAANESARRPER